MKEEIKNQILGLSVYNARTEKEDIVWIANELCKKYGWSTDDMIYTRTGFDPVEHRPYSEVVRDERKAWNYTVDAALEEKDVYAIATLLFFKEYGTIDQTAFHVTKESLLRDIVEILESIEEKDAFVYFLIGRANFTARGVEYDFDKARECFHLAAEGGIEIAKLFALEIEDNFEEIFKEASKLIEKYPDSHIIKFYLAFCYYYGYGTEKNYERVVELVKYTGTIENYNDDPIDYYFLSSRYLLGLCYFHGYVVEKNLGRAELLFRYSASAGTPEAYYCQAITELLSDDSKHTGYIYDLLKKSAYGYYLPAIRKFMLCLRKGYGTTPDKEQYVAFSDYYDHYKETQKTTSDLGVEADHCNLIDHKNNIIEDDEID